MSLVEYFITAAGADRRRSGTCQELRHSIKPPTLMLVLTSFPTRSILVTARQFARVHPIRPHERKSGSHWNAYSPEIMNYIIGLCENVRRKSRCKAKSTPRRLYKPPRADLHLSLSATWNAAVFLHQPPETTAEQAAEKIHQKALNGPEINVSSLFADALQTSSVCQLPVTNHSWRRKWLSLSCTATF